MYNAFYTSCSQAQSFQFLASCWSSDINLKKNDRRNYRLQGLKTSWAKNANSVSLFLLSLSSPLWRANLSRICLNCMRRRRRKIILPIWFLSFSSTQRKEGKSMHTQHPHTLAHSYSTVVTCQRNTAWNVISSREYLLRCRPTPALWTMGPTDLYTVQIKGYSRCDNSTITRYILFRDYTGVKSSYFWNTVGI